METALYNRRSYRRCRNLGAPRSFRNSNHVTPIKLEERAKHSPSNMNKAIAAFQLNVDCDKFFMKTIRKNDAIYRHTSKKSEGMMLNMIWMLRKLK